MRRLSRRLARAAPIIAAVAAVLAAGLSGEANVSDADARGVIRPEVRRALAQETAVPILVTLRQPKALRASRLDVGVLRSQVAATQAPVLAAVSPSDFSLTYRYQAVPALAGRATEQGLAALASRPEVVEIALDGEGSAALAESVPLIHADEVHTEGLTGAGLIV